MKSSVKVRVQFTAKLKSAMNANKIAKPKKHYRLRTIIRRAAIMIIIFVALSYEQNAIYDSIRLHNYHAPTAISQIAKDDELTPSAQRLFYVNHPLLLNKVDFAKSCPNGSQETAVLGCYKPVEQGIYLLTVSDPRLSGIEQVTAAHEMLHAAYDRLNNSDKQQVNSWLETYYQHGLHDQVIINQLNNYKQSEPKDLINEMHSIFGSEVSNLPPNLENYYKRYFLNRTVVTNDYNQYEAEFTNRTNQIKQDDSTLAAIKSQIASYQADLNNKQAILSTSRATLDSEHQSGNYNSYNAGVPSYNNLIVAYNNEVQAIQLLVSRYNSLVADRNALALEEQQLTQDISSQATPITNQ